MRTLRRLGILQLSLVTLLAVSATGNVLQQLQISDGLGLRGQLAIVAFHPTVPQGCATQQQRNIALADALTQRAALQQLASYVTPRLAHAAPDAGCTVTALRGPIPNLIVTVGKNYLVDAFQALATCDGGATACEPENARFHGAGETATAAVIGDTALGSELGTKYSPDNTRATGSRVEGASANIYQTVGTIAVDATVVAKEWGLFTNVTQGSGTMWTHIIYPDVNLVSGNFILFTYNMTCC